MTLTCLTYLIVPVISSNTVIIITLKCYKCVYHILKIISHKSISISDLSFCFVMCSNTCKMFCYLVILVTMAANADYWSSREEFIQDERNLALGSNIQLTKKEEEVNNLLMKYKKEEAQDGFKNLTNYAPAMHFFKGKEFIDKSLVFKIIKQMPKGAMLHAHDVAMLTSEWIVKNITYRDNLYARDKNGKWEFIFASKLPKGDWKYVQNLRKQACSVEIFDRGLKSLFTLEVPEPEKTYKDINEVWMAFMDIFTVITPLLTFRPVFEDYFYEVLTHLYNDNIMYLEFRGTLPNLYELNGDFISGADSVYIMEEVNKKFMEQYPDHMGMKFIYAPPRNVPDNNTIVNYIETYKDIKAKHPNFIIGFDLVGQEDLGKPLCDLVNDLRTFDDKTKFFFHAGETDWNGMPTDKNLVDAVLLNTTRIGHGYAVVKHPKVMEEVKKRDTAIEINPISNQVLKLVDDIRNHPASILFSQNFPVVISGDDPGFWGADMLSHDFYMAFMGIAHYEDDLRFLKQLILNSLKYSQFSDDDRVKATKIWQEKWELFLNSILNQSIIILNQI